jgi:hypothetical protein
MDENYLRDKHVQVQVQTKARQTSINISTAFDVEVQASCYFFKPGLGKKMRNTRSNYTQKIS